MNNDTHGYENFKEMMGVFILSIMKDIDIDTLKEQDYIIDQSKFEYILYHQYNEIVMSIDSLFLIERFITLNPPKDENINDSNYLTYHIHNYLNEIYILQDRLLQYIALIVEKYQLDSNKIMLQDITKMTNKIIKDYLHNFTKHTTGVRSQHVHKKRFQDEELKRLATTTFLSSVSEKYQIERKKASAIVKDKWSKTISKNNEETIKLLDIYFNTIGSIIAPNHQIMLPKDFNGSSKIKS